MADQPSLTVLGGPLGGRRFAFEDGAESVLIGSDASCTFRLELPGVSPIHARVRLEEAGLLVYDTQSPRGLFVNDDRVTTQMPIRNGDILWLGTPGEAGVVMIQCRVPPGASAGSAADSDDGTSATMAVEPEPEPEPQETQAISVDDAAPMFAEPIVEEVVEPTISVAPDPEPEPTVMMSGDNDQTLIDPPPRTDTDSFFDDSETQAVAARPAAAWAPPTEDEIPTSFTVEPPPMKPPPPLQFEDETVEPPPEPEPTLVVAPPAPEPAPPARPAAPPAPPVAARPATPAPAPPRPPTPRPPTPAGSTSGARPRPGAQSIPPRPAPQMARRPPARSGGGSKMPLILGGAGAAVLVLAAAGYFMFMKGPESTTATNVPAEVPTAAPTAAATEPPPVAVTEGPTPEPPPTDPPVAATLEPTAIPTAVEEVVTLVKPTATPRATTTPSKTPTKAAATAAPTANPAAQAAALKAQGDRALAAGQVDAAIGHYDEALRANPGDADATAGRARAVALRDALRRRFVAGTTSVKSAKEAKSKLTGFEDVKVAQAAEYSGRIDFEVKPEQVKPGDSYQVRVYLTNDGKKEFKLGTVNVHPVTNGSRAGGPVTPRVREIQPQAKVLIEEFPGVWAEGTNSWMMEVIVTSNRGDTFRNTLTWR